MARKQRPYAGSVKALRVYPVNQKMRTKSLGQAFSREAAGTMGRLLLLAEETAPPDAEINVTAMRKSKQVTITWLK